MIRSRMTHLPYSQEYIKTIMSNNKTQVQFEKYWWELLVHFSQML